LVYDDGGSKAHVPQRILRWPGKMRVGAGVAAEHNAELGIMFRCYSRAECAAIAASDPPQKKNNMDDTEKQKAIARANKWQFLVGDKLGVQKISADKQNSREGCIHLRKGQVVPADKLMLSMNEVQPVVIISLLTTDD
jgi:hypothetical protein